MIMPELETMPYCRTQKLVAIILTITALPQCWPLLAKGICTMPAPQVRSASQTCCCCSGGMTAASEDTATCAPGKTLLGVLRTDDTIRSDSQHLKKRLTIFENYHLEQLSLTHSTGVESAWAAIVVAHSSPSGIPAPLYLFNCSFRI